MNKQKGKVPSLLSMSTGKPTAYICKRKSNCSRCKVDVVKDENCFRIPKSASGFTAKKIFCVSCTARIVEQTKKDIVKIETMFKL